MMDAEFEGVPVSATNNYTPDTDEVRSGYRGYWRSQSIVGQVADAEFDRWLVAERAKAVADLANTIADLVQTVDTETDEPLQDWLAEQIWQLLPVEIRPASAARASGREVQ